VSKFELAKLSLKGQLEPKSPVKPTWSRKMIVLSTFLESSLNFLSKNRDAEKKTRSSENVGEMVYANN